MTYKPGGACDREGQVLLAYKIYPALRQEEGSLAGNLLPIGHTVNGPGFFEWLMGPYF